jgi:hypothetical protein
VATLTALPRTSRPASLPVRALTILLTAGVLFSSGCKKPFQVDDPQLKPIQNMLETELPVGTPEAAVSQFLSTRGYPTEPSDKPGTLIAIIRHIDTEKLQPVTARVTFYFDANGKLNTYDIVRTMNQPVQ